MAMVWNRFNKWPISFGAALLLVGAVARPAAAQTYVSTTAELEAAIAAVNSGGGGVIVLAANTFSLTAPLAITQDVTIQGDPLARSVIDGDGLFTLLDFPMVYGHHLHVSLVNLTLQNGLTSDVPRQPPHDQ